MNLIELEQKYCDGPSRVERRKISEYDPRLHQWATVHQIPGYMEVAELVKTRYPEFSVQSFGRLTVVRGFG